LIFQEAYFVAGTGFIASLHYAMGQMGSLTKQAPIAWQ